MRLKILSFSISGAQAYEGVQISAVDSPELVFRIPPPVLRCDFLFEILDKILVVGAKKNHVGFTGGILQNC